MSDTNSQLEIDSVDSPETPERASNIDSDLSESTEWMVSNYFNLKNPSTEQTDMMKFVTKVFGEGKESRGDVIKAIRDADYRLPPPRMGESRLINLHRYATLLNNQRETQKDIDRMKRW